MFILRLRAAIILCAAVLSLLIVVGCSEDSPSEPNNQAQTITVNGFVKDLDGEPVSGVTVIIKGKTPTSTDPNGGFSFSEVSTPYEVRVLLSLQQEAIVYQGLTRSDPYLLYLDYTTSTKSATISGTVPAAVGQTTLVFFVSGNEAWWTTANPTNGSYSIFADWKGSTNSYTGNLQVLRWTPKSNGLPDQYDAYGSIDNLTISQGGTFDNRNFVAGDLTDPAEQNISGSIVRPSSSYELFSKTLYLNFGSAAVEIANEGGASLADNFSYIVPSLTGATFTVEAEASLNAMPTSRYTFYQKRNIVGGSSGNTITLASSPQLNLPTHNGTGIDTTTQFLWTKGSGMGVCYVWIYSFSGPSFYIFTGGNTTSIPNLAPQGMGLPSNVSYSWRIVQFFPVASIDDAASSSFFEQALGGIESGEAYSEQFNFITKTIP